MPNVFGVVQTVVRSLIINKKRTCPKIERCGTPQQNFIEEEGLFIEAYWQRSDR